jgi:hypothetical protein
MQPAYVLDIRNDSYNAMIKSRPLPGMPELGRCRPAATGRLVATVCRIVEAVSGP